MKCFCINFFQLMKLEAFHNEIVEAKIFEIVNHENNINYFDDF